MLSAEISYDVTQRSRRAILKGNWVPLCTTCRLPAPGEPERQWADERIDELARAVAALR